jgi:hypothetical protein
MSYFSTHQMLATMESPIYQPEAVNIPPDEYLDAITSLLVDRNAIIIASADVNPLTEAVLGALYGVGKKKLFRAHFEPEQYPHAVAAIKRRKRTQEGNATATPRQESQEPLTRFFFSDEQSGSEIEQRGFRGNWLPGRELLEKYLGQTECKDQDFVLYAHLVVALNPFVTHDAKDEAERWVVLLNGISGPSTFALTQLLTGGMGGEFVDYSGQRIGHTGEEHAPPFNPKAEAESVLRRVTAKLASNVKRTNGFCGVQMIVRVVIGPPAGADQFLTFDSRRVKSWSLVEESLELIKEMKPRVKWWRSGPGKPV